MAAELSIACDVNQLQDVDYAKKVSGKIREKTKNWKAEYLQQFIKENILDNPAYQQYSEKFAKVFFYKLQGRTQEFAKNINVGPAQDSAFVVGAMHVEQLKATIDQRYNVFVVKPKSLPSRKIPAHETYKTEEEYRRDILLHDLHLFGLGPDINIGFWE